MSKKSSLGMEDRSSRAMGFPQKAEPEKADAKPVMFVVEIGSVITTVLLFKGGAVQMGK
jgi:high-affinity K+ transport system ATPase subunit B